MRYYDAHCHLQDERIRGRMEEIARVYERIGVRRVVVNGTCEADWPKVAELADRFSFVRPSFGLHPWEVNRASGDWKMKLETFWETYPESGVGEIGFDRWIKDYDIARQKEAFAWQMDAARERSLPVSIHCLQAWGILDEALRERELPRPGFMIHSYGGSKEMARSFAALGAHFSVSAYFALDRKRSQRETIRSIPLDRLLIETDAPDMLGPEWTQAEHFEGEGADEINHPGNLAKVYRFVAELFEIDEGELAEIAERNFTRLFG